MNIKNKTKNRIVESALLIFSSKGYDGCTMDDVAAASKVAKGTLYYHFKSKNELFNYVVSSGLDELKDRIEISIGNADNSYERVRLVVTVNIEAVYYNKELFRVVIGEFFGDEIRQVGIRKVFNKYLDYINSIILVAIKDEAIGENDSEFLTHMFFGAIISMAMYDLNKGGESNLYEVSEKLTKYILNALKISK